MQNTQNTSKHSTPHHKQQHGKGFLITNSRNTKVKIIVGDEEKLVDRFKVVATWLSPKDVSKPTYAFPLSMIVLTLERNGVFPRTDIEAIRIKVKSIITKCRELIVYDNRPNNPYKILAWYQDGRWLPVEHPEAKDLVAKKPQTYAS